MSNSPLVSYTKISPNRNSPRNHAIDTITIHCVVGQCTVESLGNVFANPSRQASSNYGIGYDGRIAMYCEEKDRSWCSSSGANDHRAITIEVASDSFYPYAVTDEAYKALIDLVTDICQRNGIKQLLWKADKSLIGQVDKQNMTVHRWFDAKSCPGDYLYERHGAIAEEVNKRLNAPVAESTEEVYYVKKNETLSEIAARYNMSYQDLAEYNGIKNPNLIYVNQPIRIPSKGKEQPSPAPAPVAPSKKSNEEIAKEVLAGKWGNGADRKNRLTQAGYNYSEVQAIVDKLVKGEPTPKKSVDEIAKEVIQGKWGNGADRVNRLKQAGYDPKAVQNRVNQMLK